MMVLGRATVVTLVLLGACVRGGFDDRRPGDLSAVDRARGDGPVAERAADLAAADLASDRGRDRTLGDMAPLGPFGAPVKIAVLSSSANDDDPSLTGDLLEIYFASYRPGGPAEENIYRSTRASLAAPWAAPQLVAELNSTARSSIPRVSLDGLSLYLTRGTYPQREILVSTRTSRSAPWSAPQPVPSLNSPHDDLGGSLSASGLTITFSSNRGGDHDLYLARRTTPNDPWGAPVRISELCTNHEEGGPLLDPTETVIVFYSTRPGGKGDRDLWLATRSSPSGLFGAPTPIAEVNSTGEDSDAWLSPDLRVLYFGSGAPGNCDLYVATR